MCLCVIVIVVVVFVFVLFVVFVFVFVRVCVVVCVCARGLCFADYHVVCCRYVDAGVERLVATHESLALALTMIGYLYLSGEVEDQVCFMCV